MTDCYFQHSVMLAIQIICMLPALNFVTVFALDKQVNPRLFIAERIFLYYGENVWFLLLWLQIVKIDFATIQIKQLEQFTNQRSRKVSEFSYPPLSVKSLFLAPSSIKHWLVLV